MTLSDKEINDIWHKMKVYKRIHVRKFIRELKSNLILTDITDMIFVKKLIDKLAGDKLI